jgi:hypothetical protein
MKKQLVLIILFIVHLSSGGQELITTTTANCDDELYMKLNGKWKKSSDLFSSGFSAAQQKEAFNRLDTIHKLLQLAYPQPKGLDAKWHRTYMNTGVFGYKHKYSGENENYDIEGGIPVGRYTYTSGFFLYYCFNDAAKKEVRVDGETGTWFMVKTNQLWGIAESLGPDTMTIEGRPVLLRSPVKEIWKGYQLFWPGDGSKRRLLVHRKDLLPYIPVTRRQYLEHCLKHIPTFFDGSQSDTRLEKDRKEIIEQQKKDAMKRYRDEWEKSIKENLIDSPAVILEIHPLVEMEQLPIFTTIEEGGRMLITENPAYIRKDLPKFVPQLIIMHWQWNEGYVAAEHFRKMLEENFPIEKLQAMIDK